MLVVGLRKHECLRSHVLGERLTDSLRLGAQKFLRICCAPLTSDDLVNHRLSVGCGETCWVGFSWPKCHFLGIDPYMKKICFFLVFLLAQCRFLGINPYRKNICFFSCLEKSTETEKKTGKPPPRKPRRKKKKNSL